MQPVYGQTKGLGNKTITKAVAEALKTRKLQKKTFCRSISAKNMSWQSIILRWNTFIFRGMRRSFFFRENGWFSTNFSCF